MIKGIPFPHLEIIQCSKFWFLLQAYRARLLELSPTAPQCVWGNLPASGARCTVELSPSDWNGNWSTISHFQVTARIQPSEKFNSFTHSYTWNSPIHICIIHLQVYIMQVFHCIKLSLSKCQGSWSIKGLIVKKQGASDSFWQTEYVTHF